MRTTELPVGVVRIQGAGALMIVENTQTAVEPKLLLCECRMQPRQKHCILCEACETLHYLMRDYRDPNTL